MRNKENLMQNGTRFEFLLTLGGNIIIQRFFYVNDFNPQSKSSVDLYYCVSDICDEITSDLVIKSSNYSYENQYYFYNNEDVDNNEQNSDENFLLEIKLENDIFIQRIFSANVFHPKARYSVDIRPMIREILSNLTKVLSSKNLETTYLNYDLEIKEEKIV